MHTSTDEQERIAQFWVPEQMHCGDTVMESDSYFHTMLLDDYHIHISLYSTNLKTTGNAVMIVSQAIHNVHCNAIYVLDTKLESIFNATYTKALSKVVPKGFINNKI